MLTNYFGYTNPYPLDSWQSSQCAQLQHAKWLEEIAAHTAVVGSSVRAPQPEAVHKNKKLLLIGRN